MLERTYYISTPKTRLSSSDFEKYLQAVRALGSWNPESRVWVVRPVVLLNPALRQHVETLVSLGAVGANELLQAANEIEQAFGNLDVVAVPSRTDENYVNLYFRSPEVYEKFIRGLAAADWRDGGLTIHRRVFDRSVRSFVTREIPLYRTLGKMAVAVPRGLLPRVAKWLRENNLRSNVESLRYYTGPLDMSKVTVPLRDYQYRALTRALSQLAWIGEATIMAATGSGKTEMGIAAIQALQPTPQSPVLVIAPSKDLVMQWVSRLKKYGFTDDDVAYVTSDAENVPSNYRVLVTTYATAHKAAEELKRALGQQGKEELEVPEGGEEEEEEANEAPGDTSPVVKALQSARAIIIDEAHHIPARTVRDIFTVAKTPLRLALSATPWRNDDLDLVIYAYAGEIADRVPSSELIEKGYLVPAVIFMVPTGVSGNYPNFQSELSHVLRNEDRIRLTTEIVKMLPRPVLVLTAFKEPGEALTKALKEAGLRAEFISGELSTEERAKLLDEVRRGALDVLVATTLADEGLDIPELKSLVLYYGGKSKTRVFQRIGRILRPSPGKTVGVVVDLVDNTKYLGAQAVERRKMYATEPRWVVIDVPSASEFSKYLAEALSKYEATYRDAYERLMAIKRELEARGWRILENMHGLSISIPNIVDVSLTEPVGVKTWRFGDYDVIAVKSGVDNNMVWVFKYDESKKQRKRARYTVGA